MSRHKNKATIFNGKSLICCSLLLTQLVVSFNANAAPQGGHIVGGAGSINQSALNTTIQQNSASLVIDWNSFNVQQNETVNFLQPGSSSIALNRILSNSGS